MLDGLRIVQPLFSESSSWKAYSIWRARFLHLPEDVSITLPRKWSLMQTKPKCCSSSSSSRRRRRESTFSNFMAQFSWLHVKPAHGARLIYIMGWLKGSDAERPHGGLQQHHTPENNLSINARREAELEELFRRKKKNTFDNSPSARLSPGGKAPAGCCDQH